MSKPQDTSLRYLKGIGPKRAKLLASLGLNTVEELLYYFPRRYEDRSRFLPIARLREGEPQVIKARILAISSRQSWKRRGFNIVEAALADGTGNVSCVWFNQAYLKGYLKAGQELILYGRPQRYEGKLQLNSPEFELVDECGNCSLDIGRIVPLYSLPEGITQRVFRRFIRQALDEYLPELTDCLPYDIRSRHNFLNLAKSLLNIHFPESLELQKESYCRLAFEEFLLFLLPLALRKLKRRDNPGVAHKIEAKTLEDFIHGLSFRLTSSQRQVVAEIISDMQQSQAMQRLLQGDVGSGKTVVATIAAVAAVSSGSQVAFMVPTEILARQHFEKIRRQVSGVRRQRKTIKLGLLTGSIEKTEKEKVLNEIKNGQVDLVIGTHALLEETVEFKNLGLVVIDEQHKFGVGQRSLLPKKGPNPDVLIMTATPIPRTLAITIYGDLDISVIKELPPGRLPIKTLCFTPQRIKEAYALVKEELRRFRQAYIIYPVIGPSPSFATDGEIEEGLGALDIAGAKKMYAHLKSGEFKDFRLGLIHGRMKQEIQDELMAKFNQGKIDILLATTVLEVGIDVPNVTCMLIEHAERFGLAQLHQLRGRIGRGSYPSSCILLSDAVSEESKARLAAMVKYSDGFRIAEEDLKIRGPGEFFGRRQHGLSELKIGNPLSQMQLLKAAREEALRLVAADPVFGSRANALLKEKLLQRFPEYEKLMMVG